MITTVQNIVKSAIIKGLEDKSINEKYKGLEDSLYFTLMHSLFSMAQKLALSENILEMDAIVAGKAQLSLLTELLINSLK